MRLPKLNTKHHPIGYSHPTTFYLACFVLFEFKILVLKFDSELHLFILVNSHWYQFFSKS